MKYEWTRAELAAQFERVTGESAADYPDAKAIDFLAWIRDANGEKVRAAPEDWPAGDDLRESRGLDR